MFQRTMLENCAVPDTFITNIGEIEVLGSCCRFVLYVEREAEREIVAKIIMPIENVPAAIAFTVAKLGAHWIAKPILPQFLMHMH
jgi:hypothetical protein